MANWEDLITINIEKISPQLENTSLTSAERTQLERIVKELKKVQKRYASGDLSPEIHSKHLGDFEQIFSESQRLPHRASIEHVLRHHSRLMSAGPHGWGGGRPRPAGTGPGPHAYGEGRPGAVGPEGHGAGRPPKKQSRKTKAKGEKSPLQ